VRAKLYDDEVYDNEVYTDVALVDNLLAAQFPQWADLFRAQF
jgi:hypothetical protein